MLAERRRYPRVRVESLVPVSLGPDGGGIIVDASEGGLRIRAVGLLEADKVTAVRFAPLGKQKRIESMGQIVWVDESGTGGGVRFLDLPAEYNQEIKNWLTLNPTPEETQPRPAPMWVGAAKTKSVESPPEPRQLSGPATAPAETVAIREELPAPPPTLLSYPVRPSELFPAIGEAFSAPEERPGGEGSGESRQALDSVGRLRTIFHEFKLNEDRALETARERELHRARIHRGIAAGLIAAAVMVGVVLFITERQNMEAFLGDVKDLATQGSWPSGTGRSATPPAITATPPSQPASSGSKSSAGHVQRKFSNSAKPPSGPSQLEILDSSNQHRVIKYQGPVLQLKKWPGARVAVRRDNAARAVSSAALKDDSSEEISGGLPERQEMPAYPLLALQNNLQGTVVLDVIIAKDGTVRDPQLISGPPLLASAVLDAVRKWRYTPYYRNGEPIAVERQITIDFTISTK